MQIEHIATIAYPGSLQVFSKLLRKALGNDFTIGDDFNGQPFLWVSRSKRPAESAVVKNVIEMAVDFGA
ncbi:MULTISPECIES: hypothetical protein [Pseudomonas]|uniref:hypothetical protein n=1 Tax=Pseudomonas TaxID=286 RepID=UPI001CBC48DC|nr:MULTISPECIES: hypothetical protein [Pseudomonas]MCA4074648.1 hypothetical protein [Pseudomonas kurunegalensis]MCE0937094.1 hypothetical protein [Pseudomonas kurunegalensis]MDT3745683.1 hypothetical protein [Pseudomonas kurunegalensis]